MKTIKTLFYLLLVVSCLNFAGCEKEFIDEPTNEKMNLQTALMNFESAIKSTNAPEYRTSKSELKSIFRDKRKKLLLDASKLLLHANGTTDENLKTLEKNNLIIQSAITLHFEKTQGKLTL